MVRRQLLALTLAVLTFYASTAATSVASACPRSLDTSLLSGPCSRHVDRLVTASRVTIESTSVQDVCFDSLRALGATTTSIPCMFIVGQGTATGHGPMRRLRSDFKGKLNCTFDMVAALNQSNPTQTFIMDCKENPGLYDYSWLWGILGFFGGQLVVWCLRDVIVWVIKESILLGLYVVLARDREI